MPPGTDPEDIFSDVDPAAAAKSAPRPLSEYIAAKRLAPPPQLENVVAPPAAPVARPAPATSPRPAASAPVRPAPAAVPPPAPAPAPVASAARPSGGARKAVIIAVLFVVMLAGTAALGWYFYQQWRVSVNEPVPQPTDDLNTEVPEPTPQDTQPVNSDPGTAPEPVNAVDSDADGVSDVQEREQGTNPQLPDTDGDGLGDREEVAVYRTDPRAVDTDGDGYDDGTEVQGGYNPTGPGKQLEIPQ